MKCLIAPYKIAAIFLVLIFILTAVSCTNKKDLLSLNGEDDITGQVPTLFSSLGVGDVPKYPGVKLYDSQLNENLGEIKDQLTQLPGEFADVNFFVDVTEDSIEDVQSFYKKTMKELNWEKTNEIISDNGSLLSWVKPSNAEGNIIYIIITGQVEYGQRKENVILIGFIIPDEIYGPTVETAKEGSEIGRGDVYFENPMPPQGQGLIPGKSITQGQDEWSKWLQPGTTVKGTNEVNLARDPVFGKVVEFYRTSTPFDGGAAGLYKELDIDVESFSTVNIWLIGKILRENGGNIANVNPGDFPEGAVQVRLKYIDENGREKEWYHGFFYSNIVYYDKLNFHLVTRNKWFWYIGPNLLGLNEKPVRITEIRVYGFGWQVKSHIAEVDLIGY